MMTVEWEMRAEEEVVKEETYVTIPLPRLQILTIHSINKTDNSLLHDIPHPIPKLSLASSFLSHLNPSTLIIHPETTANDSDWDSFDISRSVWTQAAATWTRVRSICLIDCYFPNIFDLDPNGFRKVLEPEDLLRCEPSIFFSYHFTGRKGGYGGELWRGDLLEFLLEECETWLSMEEDCILVEVGVGRRDRYALKKDIERLGEKWKGVVRSQSFL